MAWSFDKLIDQEVRSLINENISCAIFGSRARGDQDRYSDFDVLVVANCDKDAQTFAKAYFPGNKSVALYSWTRLHKMIAERSLFIQHLKLEAEILLDPSDTLKSVLHSFEVLPSYGADIKRTTRFLSLLNEVPNDFRGIGWATDLLAVVARNVAISRIANEGRYAFSWSAIPIELERLGLVDADAADVFQSLRAYKKFYRATGRVKLSPVHFGHLCLRVGKICGAAIEPRLVSRSSLSIFQIGRGWNPYSRCKLVERDLNSLTPDSRSDLDEFRLRQLRLRRGVLEPRHYLWGYTEKNIDVIQSDINNLERMSHTF